MINKISIKDIASYDATGIEIDDLTRINYFFGYNGTGKSTISKLLYNESLKITSRDDKFSQCSIEGFDSANNVLLVFNADFVERNFYDADKLNCIFSLNETNIEIEKRIGELNNQITQNDIKIEKHRNLKRKVEEKRLAAEKEAHNTCFNYREQFKRFSKIRLPDGGVKANHYRTIEGILRKRYDENDNSNPLLFEELAEKYKLFYETELKIVDRSINQEKIDEIKQCEKTINGLLETIIVGNKDVDIAKMIAGLDIANWVEQGVKLIDKTDGICPFCQNKTIDTNLKEQFQKFFDASYVEKLNEIKRLHTLYKQEMQMLLSNIDAVKEQYNENSIVSNLYQLLFNQYNANINEINLKLQAPNEKKKIECISDECIEKIDNINLAIKNNNTIAKELKNKQEELKTDIWTFMACESEPCIKKYNKYKNSTENIAKKISARIAKHQNERDNIQEQIRGLQDKTVNTQQAVDNINAILRNAGFFGFEIAPADSDKGGIYYKLKRTDSNDNDVFTTLSEGEKNIIAFLYFYQLCVGTEQRDDAGKKKIIVIDDPVSSMDAQSLFLVASIVNKMSLSIGKKSPFFLDEHIEQIFVLTHNIYFYKEVTLKYRHTNSQKQFYTLSKPQKNTVLLKQKIEDDYSYMWFELARIKHEGAADADKLLIANLMRRIIETYLNFTQNNDNLWKIIENENVNSPEYLVKTMFLAYINDDSHKTYPNAQMYYQKLADIDLDTLFKIFEQIFQKIGIEHYNVMMGGR